MKQNRFRRHHKVGAGFTLVEIIVAVALAAIFLPAIGKALSLALQSSSQGESFNQAYALGQEGTEAIMNLKNIGDSNWNWTTTPGNTGVGQYYQPNQSAGVWVLGSVTSTPTVTKAPFTRTVEINEVRRCGSDICTNPGAPVDSTPRKIITTVNWLERGQPQKVVLTTYVSAH